MTNPLSPTYILPQVPWAGDDSLRRVLIALGGDETRPRTLIVGGAVRNAVMGRPVADYDLATILTPDEVMKQAAAAGLKSVPTGIDHGTVTVVADGRGFEVTTLRLDVSTDGRHAIVAYTDDWAVDASRRDFTMNTLLADFAGRVYDPLSVGLTDARAGHVRFVGDVGMRIAEDYLRLLRFFRFHAHYGQGDMDAAAIAACAAAAPHISDLSRERVTQEVMKWLKAADPVQTIKTANEHNILNRVFDSPPDIDALAQLVSVQQASHQTDVIARLVVMTGWDGAGLRQALVLSNRDASWADQLCHARLEPAHDPASLRRDAARFGIDVVRQRAVMDGYTDISALENWAVPTCPVTARDLLAVGMVEGAALGARLKAIGAMWIASDFKMTRAELLTAT